MSVQVQELLGKIQKYLIDCYGDIEKIGDQDTLKPHDIKFLEERWKKYKEEVVLLMKNDCLVTDQQMLEYNN